MLIVCLHHFGTAVFLVEHGSTVFVEVRLLNYFVAGVKVGFLDFMAMRVVGKSGFSVSMFCMESILEAERMMTDQFLNALLALERVG